MMKKIVKSILKLLVGSFVTLILMILVSFIGIKMTIKTDPAALLPTTARAADGRFISWAEHRIDDQSLAGGVPLRGTDGLELADLDRDGFLDIVSVNEDSNHIRLAFGSGNEAKWDLVTLAEGDFVEGAEDPAIGDMNNDGWMDLLFACEGGTIVYFQNPGGQKGANVRDPARWEYSIPKVTKGKGSWIRVFLADLNQDGRLEAVVTNKSIKMHGGFGSMDVPKSPVSWLTIPVKPLDAEGWVENQMGTYLVPVNARPVDLDGDGDLDIVAGSRGESRMILFKNIGLNPLKFEEHPLKVSNRSVPAKPRLPKKLSGMVLAFFDLNKDNRLDIVTFETPWSIVWLEQPEDWDQAWTIHPIGAAFPDSPTALTLFDINDDGRMDLFTGGYSQDPRDHDLPEAG
ncbi:MAG: VCBS repeat-containing protein [Deltaproteobacteria bacterium]|nr:VCBS repeat-containing protein [Deltaproteobacteria bacterium]